MSYRIEKTLVLSTAHITEKDIALLGSTYNNIQEREENEPYPFTVISPDIAESWLIYVPEEAEFKEYTNSTSYMKDLLEDVLSDPIRDDLCVLKYFSTAFIEILHLTQKLGCTWLSFSYDETPRKDLKVFYF